MFKVQYAVCRADYLRVRGKIQHFQGALQMIVTAFDRVEPATVNPAEFLPEADGDCAKRLERLHRYRKPVQQSRGDVEQRSGQQDCSWGQAVLYYESDRYRDENAEVCNSTGEFLVVEQWCAGFGAVVAHRQHADIIL